MGKAKSKVTADKIKSLLDDRYSDHGKTLIAFEVADGTGSAASRWADAISMELWPSNNYKITGYEIKVSRSDWLNELKQPDKSQAISQFCDHWYLVAPDGVLGIDELPKGWGWIKATERSLTIKIRAPKRDCSEPDRPFIASFLRKSIDKYGDKNMIQAAYRRARDDEKKIWEKYYKSKIDHAESEAKDIKDRILNFHKLSGINIDRWGYEQTAEALKSLQLVDKREDLIDQLEGQLERQSILSDQYKKTIKALKKWPKVNK